MKRIVLLGSTGSIGQSTLDVAGRHPDRFQVVGLAAGGNVERLAEQVARFRPAVVSVRERADAERLQALVGNGRLSVVWGEEGAVEVATQSVCDVVVSAIVGAAGLVPTYQALASGKTVALANKESLVIAGALMVEAARKGGGTILPIDSEHSAVFQVLQGHRSSDVRRIVLTASGGPFFRRPRHDLASVTVEEALAHPNWKMGPKITVDSATLMNKGLEVIEATHLFGIPTSQVQVLIHPQSIVHAMVEYSDGSMLAQMSVPDMRGAIAYALAYPERVESGIPRLSLSEIGRLEFFEPDVGKFPCLGLGLEAARIGRSMPAVLNAANEVAVARFLARDIGFLEIPNLIEQVMGEHEPFVPSDVDDLLESDRWARGRALGVKV